EVVGSYVKLQKAGGNWRGLCPFHAEKSPSFFVSPPRQSWRCFGCSVGGDMFAFIMQIEGVEFGDALRLLAQKAGVELRPMDPSFAKAQTERKRLLDVAEWAAKFFEHQLAGSSVGKEAVAYLRGRGIQEETIKEWRLGYAPDSAQGLLRFLIAKGYREDEVNRAGLLARTDGKIFDRFRSRIVFPVSDAQGQIIGFGGRIFKKDGETGGLAKYVNVPNTPLYDKSHALYGFDKAKLALHKEDACVLVEGYMDTIAAWQAGTKNVVASSGTALTSFQLRTLKRHTENLILAYDMDLAGDSATKRGIDLALAEGFSLRVVVMPRDKDPGDAATEDPEGWARMVKESVGILDYYFQTAFARYDRKTPEGKKEISSMLLPVLKRVPNKIEQAHWTQKLAEEIGVQEAVIREEMGRMKDEEEGGGVLALVPPDIVKKTRKELLEDRLITSLLRLPTLCSMITPDEARYLSVATQEIVEGLKKTAEPGAWEGVFEASTRELLDVLLLRSEVAEDEKTEWDKEAAICLRGIKEVYIRNELRTVSEEMRRAQEEGKTETFAELAHKARRLSQDLAGLG
ncbi:MAG: DNA primase, partial [Candidatus Wildermuthbacteria bacterium]|nr:DNA primase [Candidatus Wildermuthbacteria bacterium]